MFYTYAHTKPDGTIFYIGKGKDNRAWKKTRRNRFWVNTVKKYGSFGVEILADWETEKEALEHEILLISCFRKMGYKLVNLTDGGEGLSGFKHSEEHKKKISEALRGNKNPHFGKCKTAEQKKKISETKLAQNLKGELCVNFKCAILATNITSGEEIIFKGTTQLEAFGFQNPNVFKCLNGKRKSHKGHTFKRLDK